MSVTLCSEPRLRTYRLAFGAVMVLLFGPACPLAKAGAFAEAS